MENISKPVFTKTSDDFLIQQFKDGNKDAFNALYHRYVAVVYKRVYYLIPVDDVEDVVQEIFIAASNSLPRFRGESQFSTWLHTLTNRKIAEFYRKRKRKQEPPQTTLSEAFGLSEGSISKHLEDRIEIQRALRELPENYREIILMRFVQGLQFNEIAELTGQNLEATKSLFRRAISALRDQLEESL